MYICCFIKDVKNSSKLEIIGFLKYFLNFAEILFTASYNTC